MGDLTGFLNVLKQYGPVVGLLLFFIYWQWRQIDKLLEKNATIYQDHIKALYETQNRLLTHIIGPQASSQSLPTIKEIEQNVQTGTGKGEKQ